MQDNRLRGLLKAVGKLHRDKGVYDLIYVVSGLARKYPFLKLLFVGAGPERDNLGREAERLSIRDRVAFTGVRADIERMYAAMDGEELLSFSKVVCNSTSLL